MADFGLERVVGFQVERVAGFGRNRWQGLDRNVWWYRGGIRSSALIANEDVSNPSSQLPSGRYRMARILADGTIGGQAWIVEITPLMVQMDGEDV